MMKPEAVAELTGIIETAEDEATGATDEDAVLGDVLEDPEVRPPIPLTGAQVPVAGPDLPPVVTTSTSGPGFGIRVSTPSTVVHPLLRLATYMSGRLVKAVFGAGPPDPVAMVIDAQFI